MKIIDRHDSRLLLRLLLTRGVGKKRIGRALERSAFKRVSLRDWVRSEGTEADLGGVLWSESGVESLEEAKASEQLDALEEQGVEIRVRWRPGYPKRLERALGNDAPPVLFVWGNDALLESPGIGFCGARDASDLGVRAATACAAALAKAGVNVVSGYAKGVDTAAHRAALESGGTTTIVLAEGILGFRTKRELAAIIDEGKVVVVSQFPPGLPWAAHNAMERNATICGLANALVVIEAGDSGGTLAAGRKALEIDMPLYVIDYGELHAAAPGNRTLLKEGGHPVRYERDGEVSVSALLTEAKRAPAVGRLFDEPLE
jgi:DNA processing protein